MFKALYNSNRFRYIHHLIEGSSLFEYAGNVELIPKTACFFSDDLDVYIDTSDGVNDDLQIQEYCGRILACINLSKGKKFLYLKCCYSPVWSQNISSIANENNGEVIPFFKWSFNDNFYSYTLNNLKTLRKEVRNKTKVYDIGLFADFEKKYSYPTSSSQSKLVSWEDIQKFQLHNVLGAEKNFSRKVMTMNSRSDMLNSVTKAQEFKIFHGSLQYKEYMKKSVACKTVLNPPGIGEYTSRMMDQLAVGNIIVMRKNTYDQIASWKNYIPEIDFSSPGWLDSYRSIIDDADDWQSKSLQYFEQFWSPDFIFDCLTENIEKRL